MQTSLQMLKPLAWLLVQKVSNKQQSRQNSQTHRNEYDLQEQGKGFYAWTLQH